MSRYLLLVTLILLGCGPTQSVVIAREAENTLAAAEAAGAQDAAPYEYHSAKAYLHKSKEEVGYADYEHAIDLAERALEFAKRAKAKALGEPVLQSR